MKKWEYGEESIWIEIIVIVPDHVQKREKYVNCVKDIESNQKKVETNLVLKSRHSSLMFFVKSKSLLQTFRRRTNIERMLPITPNPPMINIKKPSFQRKCKLLSSFMKKLYLKDLRSPETCLPYLHRPYTLLDYSSHPRRRKLNTYLMLKLKTFF